MAIRDKFIRLSKSKKLSCLAFATIIIFALFISIPSFARHKNRTSVDTTITWNGSVASSYRSGNGTIDNPYIISNASELAYLSMQLKTNEYVDTYFALSNDIIINNGTFGYDDIENIKYILEENTYYVKPYTNEYYDNADRAGTPIGTLNLFNSLDNFKGHFDGKSFRIYGLYISNDVEKIGLFTNLNGDIKDLYLENSIIYGGSITGGLASNANESDLSNILYNGYVIGKESETSKSLTATLTDQIIIPTIVSSDLPLDFNTNIIGEVESSNLTGILTIDNPDNAYVSLKINNIDVPAGEFNVNLENANSIIVTTYADTEGLTLTLSNLTYTINYKYAMAGGIVGYSSSSTFTNVINKSYVYGHLESGGLAGRISDTTLTRTYNTGNIKSSNISGGLIGSISSETNSSISNSYNKGILNSPISGLVGKIVKGEVSITNIMEATSNAIVNIVDNATVTINNSYSLSYPFVNSGYYNNNYNYVATIDNLNDKNYVINNILLGEFIDNEDVNLYPNNAWIYEEESLPILYIDDINKPVANIYANTFSWNSLSYELSKLEIKSDVAFSIQPVSDLDKLEIYYYISNSEIPLSRSEIEKASWISYTNIVEIPDEGYHVIYAKVIKNDSITYLNSDLLFIDNKGPEVTINLLDKSWNTYIETHNNLYINDSKLLSISALDNTSGLKSLDYYISNTKLTLEELKQLDTWTLYNEPIAITELGSYIIYVKALDNLENVSFANTDYIIYNGYTQSELNYGKNVEGTDNLFITNKSSISFNTTYTDSNICTNCSHNLVSNILFPINTILTLIDNNNFKTYTYQVETTDDIFGYNDSCSTDDCKKATYPFTLFKEIGKNVDTYFSEIDGAVNDNYKVIIDFSKTDIQTNYDNVKVYIELKDNDIKRETLVNSIKSFNIYSNVEYESTNSNLYLNVGNYSINLNSDSSTDVLITTGISYKNFYGQMVYDTTNEDKNIGLAIRLVDQNGYIVSKEKYKNLTFTMDSKEYYPDNSNTIRINLNGIENINKVLKITTTSDNLFIKEGTYYFEISNYLSYDGLYSNELMNTQLIPVTVSDTNYSNAYGFNVTMKDEDRIITRGEESKKLTFTLSESGYIYSPSVRVSLYKKNEFTAYNQEYTLIDLNVNTLEDLTQYSGNIYSIPVNNFIYNWQIEKYENFEVNLITKNLDKTSYKIVFELYDGEEKINSIEKKFIIR